MSDAGFGGVSADAPSLPGRTVFDQHWRELAFLHWAVDPMAVARFFPAGTRPDLIEGRTYVGLVPFRMARAGPGHLPVPYFGDFLETNVRLYSVDDEGHHGVLFRSLEASRLATVLVARLGLRLPYCWARMNARDHDGARTWRSRRRWPDTGPGGRIVLRPGAPVRPTPVEVFLTARWGLHSTAYGRTLWTPNRHDSWPLHAADLLELDDSLIEAAGIAVDGPPTLRALYSPGVHTVFGRPTVLRARSRVRAPSPVRIVRPARQRLPNATPSAP